VIAVGPQVTRFKGGDYVAIPYCPDWINSEPTPESVHRVPGATIDGMLAEEIVVPEDVLISVPSWLDFPEGATLPCAGATAWNALFVGGVAKPGNTVLLLGTGGVSIWALAKAAGLRSIITSSRDEKLERARSLGADHTINYRRTPEWQQEVLRIIGGRGVDVVVEVGGDGTLVRSVTSIRPGGTVAIVGGVGGWATEIEIQPVLMRATRLMGIFRRQPSDVRGSESVCHRREDSADDRPGLQLQSGARGYVYLESANHFGKVVIKVGD
jgi:NADPH:quinone reductase-like Zn-dependent oxidoreductase